MSAKRARALADEIRERIGDGPHSDSGAILAEERTRHVAFTDEDWAARQRWLARDLDAIDATDDTPREVGVQGGPPEPRRGA